MSKIRFYRIFMFVAVLFVAGALTSCKKKNTDTSKLYLSGNVNFESISPIQRCESEVSVRVYGVSHPKGKKLTVVTSFNEKKDTLATPFTYEGMTLKVKMPKKTGSYSFVVTIVPEDSDVYYSASGTFPFLVVDPDESLKGVTYPSALFTDPRDGNQYPYFEAGGVKWLSMNMRYKGDDPDEPMGASYYDEVMDRPWGRFYTFYEALYACPEGWTLPSDQDFADVSSFFMPESSFEPYTDFMKVAGKLMNKGTFLDRRLWPFDPNFTIAENGLFAALPVGYLNIMESDTDYRYHSFMAHAMFWTSELDPSDYDQALYRYMYKDSDNFMIGSADIYSMAMPVRCIKK